jgi:intein/homing endonuclease
MTWDELKIKILSKCVKLTKEYKDRVIFELKEIEKQGANQYWVDAVNNNKTWEANPSGLVIPWLLGMTPIDPIKGIPKIMIESLNGIETEAIVVKLENGQEICVSPNTQILTNIGYVMASELNSDHTIH